MRVVEIVLPVIVMLVLGIVCKKKKFLNREGIDNIKFLVTRIMVPVAVFHALATVHFTKETIILVVIILIMLLVSFGIGFLLKPLVKGPYQKYLPFMVSVYEGGMIAYPLYTSLCGNEHLSQIATLDIAGLLFGFSIYMALLGQTENGERTDALKLCRDAVRNPVFIAAMLGILAGATGVVRMLLDTQAGGIYLGVKEILTTSMSAMILLVVGFDLEPDTERIGACIKTILLRIAVQLVMAVCVLFAVHSLLPTNRLLDIAIVVYMSAPATFSMQSFLQKEDTNKYVSTVNSLYCMISIAVYIVAAAVM